MRIEWLDRALDDLEEALAYIAEQNPGAARQVAEAIYRETQRLRTYPKLGRRGRVPGTRELVIAYTHFIIPYRYAESKALIELLAVMHDARDWPEDFDKK